MGKTAVFWAKTGKIGPKMPENRKFPVKQKWVTD